MTGQHCRDRLDPITAPYQRRSDFNSAYVSRHCDQPYSVSERSHVDRARAVGLVTSVLESGCDPDIWRGASEVRRFLLSRELVAA